MITLMNGRGQLGTELTKQLNAIQLIYPHNVMIYHTWNIENKEKHLQELELEKFKSFVDAHKEEKIIFISTASEKESWYVQNKQLAESYLLQNCKHGFVLRLPTLIGKGAVLNLKNGTAKPYGEIELMSIEYAATQIIEKINYNGLVKIFTLKGEVIKANTVNHLLKIESNISNE